MYERTNIMKSIIYSLEINAHALFQRKFFFFFHLYKRSYTPPTSSNNQAFHQKPIPTPLPGVIEQPYFVPATDKRGQYKYCTVNIAGSLLGGGQCGGQTDRIPSIPIYLSKNIWINFDRRFCWCVQSIIEFASLPVYFFLKTKFTFFQTGVWQDPNLWERTSFPHPHAVRRFMYNRKIHYWRTYTCTKFAKWSIPSPCTCPWEMNTVNNIALWAIFHWLEGFSRAVAKVKDKPLSEYTNEKVTVGQGHKKYLKMYFRLQLMKYQKCNVFISHSRVQFTCENSSSS